MKKLEKNSVVIIGKKDVPLRDVLHDLVKLPAESILNYFTSLGLTFPRSVRKEALKEVLRVYVNNERVHVKPLTDELVYRLQWFETFSEAQYINLLPVFEDGILTLEFKENLWLHMLGYMIFRQVSEENINRLFSLAESLKNAPVLKVLDAKEFNNILNPIFFDEKNTIDGLTLEIFRPVVYKCSTLDEVREIGRKYGVDVPRRLRKQELVEIIKDELNSRGQLTKLLSEKIDNMTVIPLQRFAINNDIKVSIELKKEEIIEYILKNAKQTKEKYFKPQTGAYEVYDKEDFVIPVVEPVYKPEPKPEPVVEPEKPPVVEPTPIPEPKPVPVLEKVVVVFKANNDLEEEEIVEVIKGKKVHKPFIPTRKDYEFVGWYLGKKEYNFENEVLENITLEAIWNKKAKEVKVESKKALVTLRFFNGEPDEIYEIYKGEKIIPPKDAPFKEDHLFVDWVLDEVVYDFDKKVFEDITLTALWREIEKVLVRFDSNNHLQSKVVEVNRGQKVAVPEEPIKDFHRFAGWYLDGELYNFEDNVYHNLTIIADWEELEKVFVTLVNDNGLPNDFIVLVKGDKLVDIEDPVRENFIFDGYYLNGKLFNFDTPILEDVTLIAKWEEKHPLNQAMREIRRSLEEIKYAAYIMAGEDVDSIRELIDFKDKKGFESGAEKPAPAIKEQIVIMPHEVKVPPKKWKKIKDR